MVPMCIAERTRINNLSVLGDEHGTGEEIVLHLSFDDLVYFIYYRLLDSDTRSGEHEKKKQDGQHSPYLLSS